MSTARQPVLELIPRACWHYQNCCLENKMAKLYNGLSLKSTPCSALSCSTHCFHMGGGGGGGRLWPQHAEASQRGWCNRCLAEQFFGTTVYKMFLTCCWILSWYASWTRLFLHCWGAQSRRTERCTPDYVLARPLTKVMTLTITWALFFYVCRLGCAPAWCQGLLSIDLNCVHWS